METGQDVLLVVEQEQKLEQGLVQTQLQLMEVQVVMGMRLKLKPVTNTSAQVNNTKYTGFPVIFETLFQVFSRFSRSLLSYFQGPKLSNSRFFKV